MKHFLVAGFDFGTSYSKVVLRDQFRGAVKALTFGDSSSGLIPSFVRINSKEISGPNGIAGGVLLTYPKLLAADAASGQKDFVSLYGEQLGHIHQLLGTSSLEEVASLVLTRFFLSVINEIHRSIKSDDGWADFDLNSDALVVQLAVPTGLSKNNDAIDKLMQTALAAATLLKRAEELPNPTSSVGQLRAALEKVKSLDFAAREILDTRCITYPEVAAGVQTVLRSPNTPDGKYLTLDVGAGTVDLNAFYRRTTPNGRADAHSPRLDYWACEVQPLGFARLNLGGNQPSRQSHETVVKPLSEPELLAEFKIAIETLMKGAFRHQPFQVRGGMPWMNNTIAYIWGGGAAHGAFETTFLATLRSLRIGVEVINRLPVPTDLSHWPRDVDMGRLAVAYGLSFHKANLEAVRLPQQLQTFADAYPDYWRDIADETTLCNCWANPSCARCHGTGFISPNESIVPNLDAIGRHGTEVLAAPMRESRFHRALRRAMDAYHHLNPKVPIVERAVLLNQIQMLSTRPEISSDEGILSDAQYVLLEGLKKCGGIVRARRKSAEITVRGCNCLVIGKRPEPPIDTEIHSANARDLLKRVNEDGERDYVDLGCGLKRSDRREFFLEINSLDPSKRRASRNPSRHP